MQRQRHFTLHIRTHKKKQQQQSAEEVVSLITVGMRTERRCYDGVKEGVREVCWWGCLKSVYMLDCCTAVYVSVVRIKRVLIVLTPLVCD